MIKQFGVALLFLTSALWGQNAAAKAKTGDTWNSLQFLIGTWEAKTQGSSGEVAAAGTYSFQLELRGHVLARHSVNAGCKAPADFDCEHGDLLYVYRDAPSASLKAIYFDNEGHVIHYEVTTPKRNTAVFISSASQPGPQFRLAYEMKNGAMYGRFQMRMPGENEFKSYLQWSGEKK